MCGRVINYHCLFASEIDKHAQETFKLNLPQCANVLYGDITLESTQRHIPHKFDMLCAGFPCQALLNCLLVFGDLV